MGTVDQMGTTGMYKQKGGVLAPPIDG